MRAFKALRSTYNGQEIQPYHTWRPAVSGGYEMAALDELNSVIVICPLGPRNALQLRSVLVGGRAIAFAGLS